jgi:DNA-binding transcriptional regulator YiaG
MTIKEMRQASGMTQKAFSEYFSIPKRTIENWEAGKNECPLYLAKLIEYKLQNEKKMR